jgi:glycosyltransferase involved in cell wall biosynthesis
MALRSEIRLRHCRGGTLRVDGRHHSDHFESAYGSAELRIRVAIDAEAVGDIVLKKGGAFSETLELGSDLPESCLLSLEASRAFVPKELGLGDDPRELAVRISRIAVGGQVFMDFASPGNPFVGPERVRGEASGINILGYVHAELGIGESARLCAAAATSADLPISLVDFEGGCSSRTGDERWSEHVASDNPYPVNVIHVNADQLPVAYSHFGRDFFRDRYNIGVWHWELPSFPDEWVPSFSLLHEIWAPTRFILESVGEKSPIPVVLMPHAICFDRPTDASRVHFGLPADDFLFLTMYDMHSFQPRKNPEAVVEAFRLAFPDPTGVGLVVKVMNAELCPAEFGELKQRLSHAAGFHLIDETLSRQDVYRLESVCDSFVSLHRSEGFGLGLAESMYLGKPVIGTAWSGNADFMSEENSCPVQYSLCQIEEDVGPYKKGQYWAEADREHAADFMRRLVSDSAFRTRIAAAGLHTIETQHSPEVIGQRYRRRLEIVSQPGY